MTAAGWIFMGVSIGFVVALTAFCFVRVLRRPVGSRRPADSSGGRSGGS